MCMYTPIIELNNLIQTVIHFRASQRVTFAIKGLAVERTFTETIHIPNHP